MRMRADTSLVQSMRKHSQSDTNLQGILRMRVHLIRHGESIWNRLGLVQGTRDSGLTLKGKKQANLLAERLNKCSFEAIYSSSLKRAYQTANALSAVHNLPVVIEDGLREIELGDWEGKSHQQIVSQDKENFEQWYKLPLEVRIPGAETVIEFKDRVVKTIESILSRHAQGEIAIISHGGVISVYLAWLLEMNLNKVWTIALKNGALTTIDFFEHWTSLIVFNDTCHLDAVSDSLITW